MLEYLEFFSYVVKHENEENYPSLLVKLKSMFLELYESMDIDLFYLSKKYIILNAEKCSIGFNEIECLDKEINTLDNLITKLQIPMIAFIWNRIESNVQVYKSEYDLYHDIRKILLNKDKYTRGYKSIIYYYLSLIITAIESEFPKHEYSDDEIKMYQFKEIIRMSKLMLGSVKAAAHPHVSLNMKEYSYRISKIKEKYQITR